MKGTGCPCAFLEEFEDEPEDGDDDDDWDDFWARHLILDCSGLDPERIRDPKLLDTWIRKLVQDIDMKAHGEPVITYNGEEPYHSGYTVVQVITTSSIVAHFIDSTGDVYIDVFSCKPFDNDTVIASINTAFSPKRIRTNFLTRQAG